MHVLQECGQWLMRDEQLPQAVPVFYQTEIN
jgi:hypothetical protein